MYRSGVLSGNFGLRLRVFLWSLDLFYAGLFVFVRDILVETKPTVFADDVR